MLTFIVALQSPEASRDWAHVSRLCARTLRSLCAQTHPDFRVFLVCNRRPAADFTHPALTVVEEDFPLPDGDAKSRMHDKWRKVKRGLIAARALGPAHVMIADADDCVHRGLAAWSAASPGAPGWNFEHGFMHDEGSRWLLRREQFDRCCGTSAMVRLEEHEYPRTMEEPVDPYFILTHGHGVIADFLRERGTPLARLPFEGAVYMTATGENDSGVTLGGWQGKKWFLQRLLRSRPLTRRLRETYGIYPLAEG